MKFLRFLCVVGAFIITSFVTANIVMAREYSQPLISSYSQELIEKTKAKIESDTEYAQKYFGSALKLLRAETQVQIALKNISTETSTVEDTIRVSISKAGKLTDGTLIFRGKNSPQSYFTIDGKLISVTEASEFENISIWEDYIALNDKKKQLQASKDEVVTYWDKTLAPSRKKLIDPDLLNLSKQRKAEWEMLKRE